jgi:hypothetical protein
LMDMVVRQVRALTGSRRVVIYVKQGASFVPRVIAMASDDTDLAAVTGVSADDQMILRLRTLSGACESASLCTTFPRDAIAFPIKPAGALIGALVCERPDQETPFDPDERKLLAQVADELGERLLYLRLQPKTRKILAAAPTLIAPQLSQVP